MPTRMSMREYPYKHEAMARMAADLDRLEIATPQDASAFLGQLLAERTARDHLAAALHHVAQARTAATSTAALPIEDALRELLAEHDRLTTHAQGVYARACGKRT